MKDFADSLMAWWREKTNGPLYFTYLVFLAAWNWRVVQILIESASLFKSPRLEYINSQLEMHALGPTLDPVLNSAWSLIPPLVLTFISIKYLPYVNAWSHNIHLKHYFSRKAAWDAAQLEYERNKTQALQQRARVKRAQNQAKSELEKSLTKEDKWEEDFIKGLDVHDLQAIKAAYEAVYSYNGRFSTDRQDFAVRNDSAKYLDAGILSRIDLLGITTIEGTTSSPRVELTEKGRYYLRRLQETHQL